jgi:CBS domain-containing protein
VFQVSQAMSKQFIKVTPTVTIKEATRLMHDKQQNCVLVVDSEDFLEGIVTIGDIRRKGFESELSEDTPRNGANSSTLDVCKISHL